MEEIPVSGVDFDEPKPGLDRPHHGVTPFAAHALDVVLIHPPRDRIAVGKGRFANSYWLPTTLLRWDCLPALPGWCRRTLPPRVGKLDTGQRPVIGHDLGNPP